MKIICECGNESVLSKTEDSIVFDDERGNYVTLKPDTFRFWEAHDEVGIVCEKCDKSIWLFT